MSGLQAIRRCSKSAGGSSNLRVIVGLFGFALLLTLLPSLCLSREGLYYQISTGTLFLIGQDEISDFWKGGPSVGAEVGCYLGEYLSPSVSVSYTLLTPDWERLESQDTWVIEANEKRSHVLAGSFSLKVSDFEMDSILKSYISLGCTFLTRRTGRMRFTGFDLPSDMTCQNGVGKRTSLSRSMFLFEVGSGIGLGVGDGCAALIQARVSIDSDRGFAYMPIELGLRF